MTTTPAMPEHIWTCQIGGHGELPKGADGPMRDAIASAFKAVTGCDASYCFSGWGHPLPERYRAVVENRLPDPNAIRRECFAVLDTLPDAVTAPGGDFATLQAQPAEVSDADLYDTLEPAIVSRYVVERRVGGGFWGYCVKAGDGAQEIFVGHKNACEHVRQALQTACLDGAYMAHEKARTILALRPQAVPMTEKEFVACLVKANCIGVVKMSYESGPYDVTRPSINASKLKEAFEAHHGITAPAGGEGQA